MKLCVVLPAYNEETAIAEAIAEYAAAFPDAVLVVVDNNSTDATADRARAALDGVDGMVVFEGRQGKGFAVKTGLSRVDADVYVTADSDLSHPADEARRLVDALIERRADMAVGDRISSGSYDQHNTRFGHGVGNRLFSWAISRFAGARFNDVLSGLRAMSRPMVAAQDIESAGFQIETEMNVVAAYLRADVVEVPVAFRARAEGTVSKLNSITDGVRIMWFAAKTWVAFRPLQPFTLFAALALAISFSLGAFVISASVARGFTAMPYPSTAVAATAFGVIGVLSFFIGLTLHILVRGQRRRDVASFLEAKRLWNARIDETAPSASRAAATRATVSTT